MGKFNAGSQQQPVWQQLTQVLGNGSSGGRLSTPAYFNGTVYYGPRDVQAARLHAQWRALAASASSASSAVFPYPGTPPRYPRTHEHGIVWAHETPAGGAARLRREQPGERVVQQLQPPVVRDQFGAEQQVHHATIADGKVFVGRTTPSRIRMLN